MKLPDGDSPCCARVKQNTDAQNTLRPGWSNAKQSGFLDECVKGNPHIFTPSNFSKKLDPPMVKPFRLKYLAYGGQEVVATPSLNLNHCLSDLMQYC